MHSPAFRLFVPLRLTWRSCEHDGDALAPIEEKDNRDLRKCSKINLINNQFS
jgi:hypothetical protein